MSFRAASGLTGKVRTGGGVGAGQTSGGGGGSATVVSLLHFDGASGGTTFTDETGKIWTRGGTSPPTLTTDCKFVPTAGFFNGIFGTTSSWISTPDTPEWDFGAEDWTIEWWAKIGEYYLQNFVSKPNGSNYSPWSVYLLNSGKIQVLCSAAGTGWDINYTAPPIINTTSFYSYAFVRHGSNFYIFINGVKYTAGTLSGSLLSTTGNVYIGASGGGGVGNTVYGSIDEMRFTKGLARYTADYTPATSPFTYP